MSATSCGCLRGSDATFSLRARLLAGIVVLVSGALIVAAAAVYAEQRSYLYGRLDQRVIAAAVPISYELGLDARLVRRLVPVRDEHGHRTTFHFGKNLESFLPSGTYGELVGDNGVVLRGPVVVNYGDRALPPPKLPAHIPSSRPGSTPALISLSSSGPNPVRYRMAAIGLAEDRGTLIVAVPSQEVDETLDRLVVWEIVICGGTIILLSALGWLVIRIALRPLANMGEAAGAIANGDLARRVEPTNPRTEVGQLGISLNKMLIRIEAAFAAREASERRLRQFLSDASHELRTPLASIRGYTELFRMGATADRIALERSMERIEAEALRMGELVEDLLTLARVDERPEAVWQRLDLATIAAGAVADVRARAPRRAITLRADSATMVDGDAGAMRQVIDNLVGNAAVHTPERTPIDVEVDQRVAEAVLTVRDHGPGIPEEAHEHVFERFWRGEPGRSRGAGGSGLGLAIVRELLAAHGGTVSVANHPHGGAVFTVKLPLASAAPRREEPPADPAPRARAPNGPVGFRAERG